jgi:Collagen triple helix repeat (20 copies)
VHFTFDIPRGNDGANGNNGSDGSQGSPGADGPQGQQGPQGENGPQGPPFAQAVVDGVTTLDPGQPATVGVSFDGSNVRFVFGIPRGSDGSNGSNGSDGAQGPPGEVSNAQLNNAISGTSSNTNGVSTLDSGFADPDMEALRQKLNEMILAARR